MQFWPLTVRKPSWLPTPGRTGAQHSVTCVPQMVDVKQPMCIGHSPWGWNQEQLGWLVLAQRPS